MKAIDLGSFTHLKILCLLINLCTFTACVCHGIDVDFTRHLQKAIIGYYWMELRDRTPISQGGQQAPSPLSHLAGPLSHFSVVCK